MSSAYYAQSNGRAEAAVKTAKRILMDHVSSQGTMDHDAVARALLSHRNTPVQDVGLSPAMMLYGQPIKDHLPALRGQPVRKQWKEIRELRKIAMAKRHVSDSERYDRTAHDLLPLEEGASVRIQNQTGPRPHRWEKTGIVVEAKLNKQYVVKVDGSNRVTLRNRRFLRKIDPVAYPMQYRTGSDQQDVPSVSMDDRMGLTPEQRVPEQMTSPDPVQGQVSLEDRRRETEEQVGYYQPRSEIVEKVVSERPVNQSKEKAPTVRRSGRITRPPRLRW